MQEKPHALVQALQAGLGEPGKEDQQALTLVQDMLSAMPGEMQTDAAQTMPQVLAQGLPQNAMQLLGDEGETTAQRLTHMREQLQKQEQAAQTPIKIEYYHCDHLGTPMALSDQQGRIAWAAKLDPWGNVQEEYNPGGIEQPIRLPGQHHDRETGLYYNRHRYYDPAIGAYINQDPIGLMGGFNMYRYTENNPIHKIDPKGLFTSDQHIALTIEALWLCGFNAKEVRNLGYASAAGDWMPSWNESQSLGSAPWHAMGSNSVTGNSAQLASNFVADQMKIGTIESMGRAIHVVQDQAAGGHVGYQQYHGKFELDHFLMDIFPSKESRKKAIENTRNLFENCGCKK